MRNDGDGEGHAELSKYMRDVKGGARGKKRVGSDKV